MSPQASGARDAAPRDQEQRRASAAWTYVGEAREKLNDKGTDRYLTLARKLPAYLQVSGLGQTLAFLYAKGSKQGRFVENSPEGVLCSQLHRYLAKWLDRSEDQPLMALITGLEPGDYRRATWELLALAPWIKRLAEGALEKARDQDRASEEGSHG